MKESNFYIHYELNDSETLDLESLWKSIIWFNSLIKEAFKISKIDWDIEIQAAQPKQWSIIIPVIFDLILNNTDLLFGNVKDFLNFLKVTNTEYFNQANEYIENIWYSTENEIRFWTWEFIEWNLDIQKKINNFASKRPWEFWLYTFILSSFILWSISKVKNIKNQKIPDWNIPKEYFSKIKKLSKKFKKPLYPLKNWDVKEIGFSKTWNKSDIDKNTIVNSQNMWCFLQDSEMILENYINWEQYQFYGEIKNFQSSRWDFLKIKIDTEQGKKLLVCKPWDWHTTEEFIQFYKKKVIFTAEVLRESLYQLPKLKVVPKSMQEQQISIF